jgi:hypothetical protein
MKRLLVKIATHPAFLAVLISQGLHHLFALSFMQTVGAFMAVIGVFLFCLVLNHDH